MKHVLFFFFLFSALTLKAQELRSPSNGFSHKKTSYVTLKNGNQITGTLKDIDRKKGLIDFVNIEDGEGKKNTNSNRARSATCICPLQLLII